MAIEATDMDFKLSGGAANADGNASIGGVISANDVGGNIHDLFDIVQSAESAAGDVEYRLIYLQNNHGTLTAQNPRVWIENQSSSPDTDIAIGLGAAGANATESAIADEDTAPAGVTFSQPANEGAGLVIPDLAPGEYISLWIRRTVNAAAAAFNADASTVRWSCDTAA